MIWIKSLTAMIIGAVFHFMLLCVEVMESFIIGNHMQRLTKHVFFEIIFDLTALFPLHLIQPHGLGFTPVLIDFNKSMCSQYSKGAPKCCNRLYYSAKLRGVMIDV